MAVRTQVVALAGGASTWTVVGADGLPVSEVEGFLEYLRLTGCSPNTVRSYAGGAALWWGFMSAGELDWRRVGVADVGSFLSWLRFGRGAEPSEATVASRLAAVIAFYRFHETYSGVDVARRITTVGGRWRGPYRGMLGHLDGRGGDRRVPVVRVRRFGRERPPVLSPEEVEAILEDCATFDAAEGRWVGSLRDRLLFETLAETGMRLGECLALEHGDWHLGRGGVPFIDITPRLDHPAGLRVKGLKRRRVHISDSLERLYAEWVWVLCDAGLDLVAERCCEAAGRTPAFDHWYVFVNEFAPTRMAPLRPWTVYERIRTIKRHLGPAVPAQWTPHWFRHTHATTLLLSGAPDRLVARRLGHADVTTTQNLYGWVSEDAELRCLDWRRLASGWRTGEESLMGGLRAASLVKRPPGYKTRFDASLHAPLFAELPADLAESVVIERDHPLWGAFNTMGARRSVRFDVVPDPMRVELVWWAWRCMSNGSSVNGSVVWWLQRHWAEVAEALSGDGRPPPVSFMERSHAEWVAACRKVRVAGGAPLTRQNLDACTSALLARLCHSLNVTCLPLESLNVTCLPLEWWEHDLWAAGLDPRVPIRDVEPCGRSTISFGAFTQTWLRAATKWHLRVGLETNAFGWSTAMRRAEGLRRLSRFLAAKGIDDPVLVADPEADLPGLAADFLSWMLVQENRLGGTLARSFCRDMQSVVGSFYLFMFDHRIEAARTLNEPRWRGLSPFHPRVLAQAHRIRIPRLKEQLLAFDDDVLTAVSAHVDLIGLPKDETKQILVDGAHVDVAGIGDPQAMRIYLLLVLLGRRASEILLLDRDPLLPISGIDPNQSGDGQFVARLRYAQTKIEGAPDTIPVGADVVNIIREQQAWLDERLSVPADNARWLFVRHHQNRLGTAPYTYSTLAGRLAKLAARIVLRDSQGHPVKLTRTHALRHTKATGLINAGVPLSVVQRYMGHVSPVMTSHYAKLREATIQEAFLTLAKRRADGTPSPVAADDLYDLLQLDQRTDRVLPNGWCMLPPRQVCEKGNACFTCDMFVTDRSHLPVIERQRAATGPLIEQRRQDFEARHGEPMSDTHVWLEPRLREARALDRLLAALHDDHGQAIRGAGVAARLGDDSPVVLPPPSGDRHERS